MCIASAVRFIVFAETAKVGVLARQFLPRFLNAIRALRLTGFLLKNLN